MKAGPKMMIVLAYVARHPGCPKIGPAREAGPHRSLQYGYRAVDRCLSAGLIHDRGDSTRQYSLCLTPEGRAALAGAR